MENKKFKYSLTESEWKEKLTNEEYRILRKQGTERPFTGEYDNFYEEGLYTCKGCENELFTSVQKFNSSCGWPSFDNEIKGSVYKRFDDSHGMRRVEIVCNNCGSHLGHIFNDGPTDTGLRYCVNSASITHKKSD